MSGEAYPIRAAVLTVSDRCSRGEAVDTSGPGLCEMLRSRLNAVIVATRCLPDEADALAACFVEWSRAEAGIDLVLSTGGTGLAPRRKAVVSRPGIATRPRTASSSDVGSRATTSGPTP